ncbi:MAG: hypothetical protein JWQ81_3575 [Amycolatopsis sp.]|nr:hypothetical protein [Amycolatopsis sp.]
MNEDEIRSLLLHAAPREQPSTAADLAELLGRGRHKRKIRGYLVIAGSAVSTAAVAVLIVALAVGRSAGGAQLVPADQPAAPPMTSSTTDVLTPSPTTTSRTGTTPNTPSTPMSSGRSSSTVGTTPTHPAGATTTP